MTANRPTPDQVDDLCIAYDSARIAKDNAEQELSRVKGELLSAVQAFGYTPSHAEKTMRLEGHLYTASATVGTTVDINEAKVEELQSELSRIKRSRIFRGLFQRTIKYSLIKDGPDAFRLATAHLAADVQSRLHGIFTCCFKVNAKAPSLSVDLIAALRAKEAEAAKKAARRAAKKGSK